MEKKQRKATKAQRERIDGMLESGHIGRSKASEIIANPRAAAAAKALPRFTFWEERFPGRGQAILDLLDPFYGWVPALKPTFSGLGLRAQVVNGWRTYNRVMTFTASKEGELARKLYMPFGDVLLRRYGDLLSDLLQVACNLSLGSASDDAFRRCLKYRSINSVEPTCLSSLPNALRLSLLSPLALIVYASAPPATILRDDLPRFASLHDLWLAGNFPVGFDKDDNLLILVAD